MSSMMKILLGGLATALLTWVFYGPLAFCKDCMTPAAAPAVVATAETPATTESVANCQAGVDATIKGKTINFESGNAVIKADSTALLDALATAAKDCAGTKVEVAGHTDQQGGDAANLTLSESRAKAVVAELAKRGVPGDRMSAKGYGETKLLDQGETAEALAKNRRIEFTVSTAAADAAAKPAG
jgi:outer membrane protein OmpA-like peptidoglycan-associated protein